MTTNHQLAHLAATVATYLHRHFPRQRPSMQDVDESITNFMFLQNLDLTIQERDVVESRVWSDLAGCYDG